MLSECDVCVEFFLNVIYHILHGFGIRTCNKRAGIISENDVFSSWDINQDYLNSPFTLVFVFRGVLNVLAREIRYISGVNQTFRLAD